MLLVARHLIWFINLGAFLLFGILIRGFFTVRNLIFVVYTSSLVGFLVFAQSLCLISRNFDLSVDRIACLSVLIVGVLTVRWIPGYIPAELVIVLTMAVGAVLGSVNGFFVGKLRINSFLVTLSTYLIYMYVAYSIIAVPIAGYELPYLFLFLGGEKIGLIPVSIFVLLGVALFLEFILKRTTFGLRIFAVGGDYEGAKMLGIDTENTVFWVYTIVGAISGLAGLIYAGFAGAITNALASGEFTWSFAGAIIGGVSLLGGRGSMIGALGGTLLIGTFDLGTGLLMIPPNLRNVIKGLMVLVAILIDRSREKWIDRLLMPEK